MQKSSIRNNQIAYVWLIALRNVWVSPSMFKKVLRITDYSLRLWLQLLNPFRHVRHLVILPRYSLQDTLSSSGESMDRYRVAIVEPKSDSGMRLASCGQLFIHENRRLWIAWAHWIILTSLFF